MAKSKITIKFLAPNLWEGDTFTILVNTPLGTQTIKERFVNNPPSPRPSGYAQIVGDASIQAKNFYDALVADYLLKGYVTFSRNVDVVTIEAVNECETVIECTNYVLISNASGGNFTIGYTNCLGVPKTIVVAPGFDESICAQKNSINVLGGLGKVISSGSCETGIIIGPTTFSIIQTPTVTTAFELTLVNNDCGGYIPPTEGDTVVFSEASSNPCSNINICVTTNNLLVKLGTIDNNNTEYKNGYPEYVFQNEPYWRSDPFKFQAQWRALIVSIDVDGGIPNLYPVNLPAEMTWTTGTFNPSKLHPTEYQFFLRNNSIVRTISIILKYDVTVNTSSNSIYDVWVLHRDLAGNIKEFRKIGGPGTWNTYFDYSINYSGDFTLAIGDELAIIEHVLGDVVGNTWVDNVVYKNFQFSILDIVDNTTPNGDNPICSDIPRGQDYTLEGYDAGGNFYSETFTPPPELSIGDISVIWENGPIESKVTIEHNTGLTLMYNIDGGTWQILNIFYLIPGNSYTLNIKDEYGCELAIPFTIDSDVHNEPKLVTRWVCNSLHELNVGKYLNLCGKQYTMKIGFICNVQPNTIKIFKHVQMILNTKYAIKNICITTSQEQERFVPGTHMVYRIRESMHSVPLKNPDEFDDLRGSWAYMEIEIESIDNQKVDLFSVITHLRKSTI